MPNDAADWTPAETLVTVEFFDRNGATEVVLTHQQFPDQHMRDEHEGGWGGALAQLERYLTAQ